VIDLVLHEAGLSEAFEVTVSSEEVERGKPAPDVYLEAATRLGLEPARCAAVEDSANGIRSAHRAGMRVIVIPNSRYPPAEDALAEADVVLDTLAKLTPAVVLGDDASPGPPSSSPLRA
jgi:beta-phosphoglucomutase-like phosphatase (HAD superfamily)